MAAYHWEARRRQIMLDRRQALQARAACERRQYEDPMESAVEASQKQSSPPCPDPDAQQPAPEGTTEDRCPCNTDHVSNHSGKLMKRYSDFEYIQQW